MITYRQPFFGEYPITQYYGEKITSSFHTGIDYGCPMGTPICASADGVIRFIGMDKTGYGNCVIIEHDVNHATLYAHLSTLGTIYFPGTKVKQGEVIGWSGSTGNSTGPHLHFEARRQWNDFRSHFDPMNLPLMSVDDSVNEIGEEDQQDETVLSAYPDLLNDIPSGPVVVAASSGAFMHNERFTAKQAVPFGTKLYFTGKTKEKGGLTFCECTVWIAANDGSTQILLPDR